MEKREWLEKLMDEFELSDKLRNVARITVDDLEKNLDVDFNQISPKGHLLSLALIVRTAANVTWIAESSRNLDFSDPMYN
jgi:hypothetical protein